jgi:hypothetical protein
MNMVDWTDGLATRERVARPSMEGNAAYYMHRTSEHSDQAAKGQSQLQRIKLQRDIEVKGCQSGSLDTNKLGNAGG